MDLAAYMQEHGIDDATMGAMIGRNRVSVSRYRRGLECPSSDVVKTIVAVTKGAVTANELLGIEQQEEAAQ